MLINLVKRYLSSVRYDIIGRDGSIYLRRYRLVQTRYCRVYLHHILRSDEDRALHDHPWRFVSIILHRGYIEHTPKGLRRYGAGSVLVRPAAWQHRLEVPRPAWSLVIAGPRVRDWGFITDKGWCFWKTYMAGGCE